MMQKWLIRVLPVLLALVLVVGSCVRVRAADENYAGMDGTEWHTFIQSITFPGTNKTMYENWTPYYSAVAAGDGIYYIIFSTSALQYTSDTIHAYGNFTVFQYNSSSDSCSMIENVGSSGWTIVNDDKSASVGTDFFISNYDIKYKGLDDVFFHQAPSGRLLVVAATLKETPKEIVAILPLLIPLLVSLLGLRKGLRFISTILRTA